MQVTKVDRVFDVRMRDWSPEWVPGACVRWEQVWSVVCPKCNAMAGEGCTGDGYQVDTHDARIVAAQLTDLWAVYECTPGPVPFNMPVTCTLEEAREFIAQMALDHAREHGPEPTTFKATLVLTGAGPVERYTFDDGWIDA